MSITKEVVENAVQPEAVKNSSSVLDDLFKDRDNKKPEPEIKQEDPVSTEKKVKEVSEPNKTKENKQSETKSDPAIEKKEDIKKPQSEDEDEDDPKDREIEKLKKALNDNQKWGHTNNKRLKSVAKKINSMKESGVITESEFSELNEMLQSDQEEEPEKIETTSNAPLGKFMKIANNKVADLAEIYDPDNIPLFNKKIGAFDKFVFEATPEELDDLEEEFEKLQDNPLRLAKRMYQIGEKFYNDHLKEIEEAGGMKEIIAKKNAELEKKQKKIDKLEKELLQYADYDKKSTYKIDELGETEGVKSTDKPGDVLGSLFKERDRKKG
jgi:hypothetical protein